MPEKKHKRAKNIIGKEFRTLAAEAIKMPREPTINLARRLVSDISWPGPAPSVEVLKKKITEIRKKSADFAEMDAPWSVVTMTNNEYQLPPDTLPIVMKMWMYFRQSEGRRMTIREALWTARLSALYKNGVRFKSYASFIIDYAAAEKLNEAYGRDEGDELVTDSEMYHWMTKLGLNDQVVDASGKEQESQTVKKVREGLEEERRRENPK